MARGSLKYISLYDGLSKRIDREGTDSLRLLDTLKCAFRDLFFNDAACCHGADIMVFDEGSMVFHYEYNNGCWRDKTSIFS